MAEIIHLYKTSFDPVKYAEKYYSVNSDHQMKTLFIDFLHELFSQGKLSGERLLDVGSGSTVHSIISASNYMKEVFLSDLLESNRKEVLKWLHGESGALDFTWQLEHVAQLEGHGDGKRIRERILKVVKDVLPCNVLLENPLAPVKDQFDVVTSSLCLEVFPNMADYFKAARNMASLVLKGGFLVLQGSLNRANYQVGDVEFPTAKKDASTTKRALEEANLKIIQFNEHLYKNESDLSLNNGGRFTVLALKM